MNKRGQLTIFVALGIITVILIILFFTFKSAIIEQYTKSTDTERYLRSQMDQINKDVELCINEEAKKVLNIYSLQGGSFEPINHLLWYGDEIKYRCTLLEKNCASEPFVPSVIEKQLNKKMGTELIGCIDLSRFRGKDFEMEIGELSVTSTLGKGVLFNINYPITISKNNITKKQNVFTKKVDVPLLDLIKVSNEILNTLSRGEKFISIDYVIQHFGKYRIDTDKPYPHTVYKITDTNTNYTLQFAIEGEGRYESAY